MNSSLIKQEQSSTDISKQNSLAPRNMLEAIEFAKMMANSDFVPKDCKGKPGNILAAVQFGAELGLAPMQAMQNIAVINGRPCLWGDAMQGLVQASGLLEDMKEWDDGETAFCKVKRKGFSESHTVSFSNEDAKRAGLFGKQGPWSQYPTRMRKMRARAFALRDQFADVLRGINSAEEVSDYVESRVIPIRDEHKTEKAFDAEIQPTGSKLPDILARFIKLNDDLTAELGEDAFKYFLKNSKGESPTLEQIMSWRMPKQLALLRTACDKIEQHLNAANGFAQNNEQEQVAEVVNG